jgi:hypothetical protein
MATVDRGLVKMIAYKRLVTGSLSIGCGVALVVALAVHGHPPPTAGFGLVLFFGGGAWALRDGLRLRSELRRLARSTGPS